MRPKRYPVVQDAPYDESRPRFIHVDILVTWKEGDQPQRFCGDNWCTGNCGLPALIIPWPPCEGRERYAKVSGSQVACGPLMQAKRVEWMGEKIEVPEEHRADFNRRLWW